jgi:hypothetical protein
MPSRDDKRRQQIAELRANGLTLIAIGASLEPPVTAQTVHRTLIRLGMPGRVKLGVDKRRKKASN